MGRLNEIKDDYNDLPVEEMNAWTLNEYYEFRKMLEKVSHACSRCLETLLIINIPINKTINLFKLKTMLDATLAHVIDNEWSIFNTIINYKKEDDILLSELCEKFGILKTF